MNKKQESLSNLPSVDEVLKSSLGQQWLGNYPRKYVLSGIREGLDFRRKEILEGTAAGASLESMAPDITRRIEKLSSYSLTPVINATGVVIHTNLGRSVLSEKVMGHVKKVAEGYSNLEYDLDEGRRGKRHVHIRRLLRETTGAEDGFAVNNNAAAVLLCLSSLAKGREVVVSRGELVEIGGSFRVPEVMAQGGAILREVGTTNKTHLHDYANAVSEATGLILKVHQSNYRITGFTDDVPLEKLAALGHGRGVPVMYDWGSGCLADLRPYGVNAEPTIQEILKSGVDIVTFSGDKLLGGPQAGLIIGRGNLIERIQRHPLARAVRIDKLSLAALEATLLEYADEEQSRRNIPTLRMLLEDTEHIRVRAKKIAGLLKRAAKGQDVSVVADTSQSGGGSLPGEEFRTYAVCVRPGGISVNELEERLRKGLPPVIARIREGALLLDARTVFPEQIPVLVQRVAESLQ